MTDEPTLLDLMTEARAARDEGMNRAAAHAERVTPAWGTMAYRRLVRFAHQTEAFTTEQARAWAYADGLLPPPNECAWGAVVTRAVKAGVLTLDDFATAENVSRHCGINRLWRSNLYRREVAIP
jgi:hypothetical protein